MGHLGNCERLISTEKDLGNQAQECDLHPKRRGGTVSSDETAHGVGEEVFKLFI